jgi:hypothetical protein
MRAEDIAKPYLLKIGLSPHKGASLQNPSLYRHHNYRGNLISSLLALLSYPDY